MSTLQVQCATVKDILPPKLPAIRLQCASPRCFTRGHLQGKYLSAANTANIQSFAIKSTNSRSIKIQRREELKQTGLELSALPIHMVKEREKFKAAKSRNLVKNKRRETKEAQEEDWEEQDSDQHEPKEPDMLPQSHTMGSCSSSSTSPEPTTFPSGPTTKPSKASAKSADWADVTDPEERRRIQNRIAQRKFREKTRENKEKAEREARNQEHAGNSYRRPSAEDFMNDAELSGLPWGSVNFGLVVSRTLEMESQRSSGRGTYMTNDGSQTGPFSTPSTESFLQATSFMSSGTDDAYMGEDTRFYSPGLAEFSPFPPPQ